MRTRLLRPLRLGLPAVAVVALVLTGCSDPAAPAPAAPSSSSAPTPAAAVPTVTGDLGSDGLTVRYLGDDGGVKTVRVEDFPR